MLVERTTNIVTAFTAVTCAVVNCAAFVVLDLAVDKQRYAYTKSRIMYLQLSTITAAPLEAVVTCRERRGKARTSQTNMT